MLAAIAVAVTAVVTATGAHATTSASGGAVALATLARATIVGVPLAVAIYATRRPAHARFGTVLLVVGGLWFLSSLATASSPLLFSIARLAGWVAEPALAYALLAFPDGRLRARADRVLVATAFAILLLYLPTVPFVEHYPAPWPWQSCYHGCPTNAFMVVGHQPTLIDGFLVPVRQALTGILFLVVSGRLAVRIGEANALVRRTLSPVLGAALLRWAAFAALLVAREISADSTASRFTAWAVALAVPLIAIAFLVGLLRWHLFVTAGIRIVNSRLRHMPGPEQVRDLLADAFDDPEIEIASWFRNRRAWIAADGHPLRAPPEGSNRWLTEVKDGHRRVVAIVHDIALRGDLAFIEAAAAASTVAFASERVAARTGRMVSELRESRARILAAADGERRRIERDLHDGAQQRLVGLCIHLELAAENADREHPAEASALRDLVREVEQALEEMRSLTHGIYPALLLDRGVAEAVRSAARRSPVATTVQVRALGEYTDEVATAVYFCCIEALQNVAKHARGAGSARIVLEEADSALSFSVSDDGPGILEREATTGAGMLNMHDRMTTVGGELTVQSHPGRGTRVSGRIPITASPRPVRPVADGRNGNGGSDRSDGHSDGQSRPARV